MTIERTEISQVWLRKPVIPVTERLRKEDCEFRTSQGSIVRYYLRKYQNKAGQKFYHTLFYTPTAHRKIIHKLDIANTISRKKILKRCSWDTTLSGAGFVSSPSLKTRAIF